MLCYLKVHWLILYFEWIVYPCMAWFCNTMNWSFGKYRFTELWRSSKYWHISLHNIKTSHLFVNITNNLIRKVCKHWEAIRLTVVNVSFPNFYFLLKSSGKRYCPLFSLKWQIHFVCFQENFCQIPKSKQSVSVVLSSKNNDPWTKQQVQHPTQIIIQMLFLEPAFFLQYVV